MDQQDRDDAIIELGLFVDKLKEIIQKYPEGVVDEDRSILIIAKEINQAILKCYNEDMSMNDLVTQLYRFFREGYDYHHRR